VGRGGLRTAINMGTNAELNNIVSMEDLVDRLGRRDIQLTYL
jgi:hypothetical protein